MSSHHFVKEDQEPALLIVDANAASVEQLKELLEWSPTVIVLAEILEEVLTWGIKIDIIIVKQKELPEVQALVEAQMPVQIITRQEQDDPVLTALYVLQTGKYQAVNILGSEFELIETTPFTLDIVVFQNQGRWSFIRTGTFEKWVPAGRVFNIKVGGESETISATTDGSIIIEKKSPFWISEC